MLKIKDVVIIDEAHLLLTQGKMSYRGEGHLKDIQKELKSLLQSLIKTDIK